MLNLSGKGDLRPIELEEDDSLLKIDGNELPGTKSVAGRSSKRTTTFHDEVMAFKDDPNSNGLRDLLLNINEAQFQELREESATLALPVIISLADSEGTTTFAVLASHRIQNIRHLVCSSLKALTRSSQSYFSGLRTYRSHKRRLKVVYHQHGILMLTTVQLLKTFVMQPSKGCRT